MGASVSNTDVTNKVLNSMNSLKQQIVNNSCSAGQTAGNNLDIEADNATINIYGDITQKNIIENVCKFKTILSLMSDTTENAKAASEMIKKQSSGLFGLTASNTKTYNSIENVVSTKELVSVINNCAQKASASNVLKIIASNKGEISIEGAINQINNLYNKCVIESLSDMAVKYDISTDSDLKTKEDSKVSILPDTGQLVAIIIAILVVMFIMFK